MTARPRRTWKHMVPMALEMVLGMLLCRRAGRWEPYRAARAQRPGQVEACVRASPSPHTHSPLTRCGGYWARFIIRRGRVALPVRRYRDTTHILYLLRAQVIAISPLHVRRRRERYYLVRAPPASVPAVVCRGLLEGVFFFLAVHTRFRRHPSHLRFPSAAASTAIRFPLAFFSPACFLDLGAEQGFPAHHCTVHSLDQDFPTTCRLGTTDCAFMHVMTRGASPLPSHLDL